MIQKLIDLLAIKNNERPYSHNQVKQSSNLPNKAKNFSEIKLREHKYSKRSTINKDRFRNPVSHQNSRLVSRDERLKAPKSSHLQVGRQKYSNNSNSESRLNKQKYEKS